MFELKKFGTVFTSKFVGTGPSSYEKRIYRAAVSQKLRSTALSSEQWTGQDMKGINYQFSLTSVLSWPLPRRAAAIHQNLSQDSWSQGWNSKKCSFSDMTARVLDTRTDVISHFPSTRLTYKLQRVVNMFTSCDPYLRAEGNVSCTFFTATFNP